MVVLVKGMEMPENCWDCSLLNAKSCPCKNYASALEYTTARHPGCPLVEVPEPHGRLISADELIEFIENRYEITWKDDYEGGIKDACVDILEKISTMPTVIPASEEGE
jgi:hypothetical protein